MTTKGFRIPDELASSPLYITAGKSRSEMTIAFSGILSVTELGDEGITLNTASGTVSLKGKGLRLAIFENKMLEITGRVEEVHFGYGRS